MSDKHYRCIETLCENGVQVSVIERLHYLGVMPAGPSMFWAVSKDEAVKAFIVRKEKEIKLLEQHLDDARKSHRMATLGKFDMYYSDAIGQAIAENAAGIHPLDGADVPASWQPPGERGSLGNALSETEYLNHVKAVDSVGDRAWNRTLRRVLVEDDDA